MEVEPELLVSVGDVFLNLSAVWFAAAIIIPGVKATKRQKDFIYIIGNVGAGIIALAIGYQLRIL